jgi:hypothetical protein
MARQNSKKSAAGFVFPAPLAIVLVVVAGLSLCYVCLNDSTASLQRELQTLEARREGLRRKLAQEQGAWSLCLAPNNIARALQAQGLVMTWPGRDQYVRLPVQGVDGRPAAPHSAPGAERVRYERIVMND